MKKYLIVLNPVSGSGKGKKSIKEIESFFIEKRLTYKLICTDFHLHATKIVKENINDFDVIICAGGDGTVNEVINGFIFPSDKIFAVLPIGSGNDYAANLNLSKQIRTSLEVIVNQKSKVIQSDIISIKFKQNDVWKEKLSINAIGIGFDAYVAFKNQHNKKISGILSYILAVFVALKDLKTINFKLRIDDVLTIDNLILATIGNGKTSGGGFYLTPSAFINDGLLNITTISDVKKLKLLKELPKALFNKMHKVKEAKFFMGKKICIELDTPYYVHSDGEILGTSINQLEINILEHKLNTISL